MSTIMCCCNGRDYPSDGSGSSSRPSNSASSAGSVGPSTTGGCRACIDDVTPVNFRLTVVIGGTNPCISGTQVVDLRTDDGRNYYTDSKPWVVSNSGSGFCAYSLCNEVDNSAPLVPIVFPVFGRASAVCQHNLEAESFSIQATFNYYIQFCSNQSFNRRLEGYSNSWSTDTNVEVDCLSAISLGNPGGGTGFLTDVIWPSSVTLEPI